MKKPTKKPASAGKPLGETQKEEAQKKPAGTMEKPIWEGKYTAIIGGRKYSKKAYQTAKAMGLALGELTEGAFWGIVHSAKAASGKALAQKRFDETETLEEAKEGRRELAAKQKQARALMMCSKLWGDLREAKEERKAYVALTKEHEEELWIASKVAKGWDEHSARALWEEKQAKKAQREIEARERAQREAQKEARKRDLEGWERIQREKAQMEREAQAQAQKKPASKGGEAPASKKVATRA